MSRQKNQAPRGNGRTKYEHRSKPEGRLVGLHRERGDAGHRLEEALTALERADWGQVLAGEAALAAQLRATLGAGVLRVDSRIPLRRELLAEAGLAVAGLDGDWRGAVGVLLLEPEPEQIQRAQVAGVRVLVDATLAPGGGGQGQGWLQAGADYLLYTHAGTLSGFGETELAALFGRGSRPQRVGAAPTDLATAHTLRDVATLPLRLTRVAQTVQVLAERLGGRALSVGSTALLLPPESALPTTAPLGGVVPTVRAVSGGMLLTPGLLEADAVLTQLGLLKQLGQKENVARTSTPAPSVRHDSPSGHGKAEAQLRSEQSQEQGRGQSRTPSKPEQQQAPSGQAPLRQIQPQLASEGRGEELERFVFESGGNERHPSDTQGAAATSAAQPEAAHQPESGGDDNVAERQSDRRRRDERGRGGKGGKERRQEEQAEQRTGLLTHADVETLAPDLPATPKAEGAGADPFEGLSDEQGAVFARLREWRNAEAARLGISRFIIASNATLAGIARHVPYTPEDLRAVKGMGPARVEKYGDAILAVVKQG